MNSVLKHQFRVATDSRKEIFPVKEGGIQYIEMYCNHKRAHSTRGYLSSERRSELIK